MTSRLGTGKLLTFFTVYGVCLPSNITFNFYHIFTFIFTGKGQHFIYWKTYISHILTFFIALSNSHFSRAYTFYRLFLSPFLYTLTYFQYNLIKGLVVFCHSLSIYFFFDTIGTSIHSCVKLFMHSYMFSRLKEINTGGCSQSSFISLGR